MNKSKSTSIVIVIVLVVIGVIWYSVSRSSKTPGTEATATPTTNLPSTPSAPVSGTTKVSNSLSEYKNDELGFSVKYPSVWEKEEANAGVNFIIPVDKAQVTTVATLQSLVEVYSGTCAFPPVTSGIKERSVVKVGTMSFNMLSLSNVVQGRTYTNRMYSLQKDKVCYMFSFSGIAQSLASQNLTGSKATQAENNNKAIVTAADKAFTDMVKSFTFVVLPQGQDETKVVPKN